MGIQNNLKIRGRVVLRILGLGNSAWNIMGVNIWSRDHFVGFDLCPPFDHPRHLKSGIPPWGFLCHETSV